MHIKGAHEKLLKLVVISTIFFLILLLTLSMADYAPATGASIFESGTSSRILVECMQDHVGCM